MSEKIADGWESVDEKVLVFKREPFWDKSYHRFDGFGKSLGVEGNISYRVDGIFQYFGVGFMGGETLRNGFKNTKLLKLIKRLTVMFRKVADEV